MKYKPSVSSVFVPLIWLLMGACSMHMNKTRVEIAIDSELMGCLKDSMLDVDKMLGEKHNLKEAAIKISYCYFDSINCAGVGAYYVYRTYTNKTGFQRTPSYLYKKLYKTFVFENGEVIYLTDKKKENQKIINQVKLYSVIPDSILNDSNLLKNRIIE
jgi:hypothetical protein